MQQNALNHSATVLRRVPKEQDDDRDNHQQGITNFPYQPERP